MRNSLLLFLITFTTLSCSTMRTGGEKPGDCGEIPVGITTTKGELDLAGAKLGDFSLTKLNITFTPEFKKLFSDAASNALLQDYIRCKAIARAGVHSDPEMVDYFMRLTLFLSTERTVDEQIRWREANPLPKKKGKLQLSGPTYVDSSKPRIFEFSDQTPQRVMGVINAGEGPLTWWYDYFPTEYFYSDFHLGDQKTLVPKDNVSVDIILKAVNPKKRAHDFKIKADNGEEVTVQMEITGSPYNLMASELNARVLAGNANFSNLIDSSLVTKFAGELVDERFKEATKSSKQFLVSQVLLAAAFPDAALKNFKSTRGWFVWSPDKTPEFATLENGAEIDAEIQHLKWAVWNEQNGSAHEVVIHTEQAFKTVAPKVSRLGIEKQTIRTLKEASDDARKGNTNLSALKARSVLTDLGQVYLRDEPRIKH